MNTLTILPPIQPANESLAKLLATAREKFAAEFQDGTVDFDAPSWDISQPEDSLHPPRYYRSGLAAPLCERFEELGHS